MEIDDSLIDHLSNLSKLNFEAEAKAKIKADLKEIISFVEKLNELDTKDVTPLVYMNEDVNVWRADISEQKISKQEALMNAPDKNSDYFKVPKVINK